MPQNQLHFPGDLLLYGASSDFLDQFAPRPLTVEIVAGGALGAMTWAWKQAADSAFGSTIATEAIGIAPYVYSLPDPGFAALTFAPGTYVLGTTYGVSPSGIVTPGAGAFAGLSAVRTDLRQTFCLATQSKAITWLTPRVVPPVISVGQQIIEWMSSITIYGLRSRQGMTPADGGAGDDNLRARAEAAEKNLKEIGLSEDRPPDLADSSVGNSGAGFTAYPVGDDLTGW